MKIDSNKLAFLIILILARITIGSAQTQMELPLQPEKLKRAQKTEQEAILKKDTLLMAEAYYLYGKVHVAARGYLKAKDYYMKSLRIVEKQRDFGKVARLYLRLAEMENDQANTTQSLAYAHVALGIWKRIGSKKNIAAVYQRIGAEYVALYRDSLSKINKPMVLDSLLYYSKTSEQMAYELNDSLAIVSSSHTLGDFYRLQRNIQAFRYYRTALDLYTIMGRRHQQADIMLDLALTYLRFNQPAKAYPLLKEAERTYQTLQIREFDTEKTLADAYLQYYQQKKKWEKAFEQSQIVRRYEHDQMTADRDGAVSRLSVEYDTKKKEIQLKSQQRELVLSKENEQTQRRFLGVLSALLLGAVVASGAFYRFSRKNQRLSLHNAALVQEQNHRVKNNLQVVSSLLSLQSNRLADEGAKNAIEDSQRRIEVMSLLQRKLYDGENLIAVNLADFIQELTEMGLKTFEFDQVEVTYQIPATLTLSADYVMRVGLILNELLTNACKYAFPGHPDPTLRIEAHLDKTTFHLSVADNGKGFDESSLLSKSFGMRLIQMQVEQLYGTYRIQNKGGMTFTMTFNLMPSFSKKKLTQFT